MVDTHNVYCNRNEAWELEKEGLSSAFHDSLQTWTLVCTVNKMHTLVKISGSERFKR